MALISVVVPVYHNAPSLSLLWERLEGLSAANPRHAFEFIFVDDGSDDDSYQVLAALARRDDRICVVKLTRNFGSNAAILAGMAHARGDGIGFIAADLQDPPETLSEMISLWERGHRVVLAVRADRDGDPWPTRLSAGFFNRLLRSFVFRGFPAEGIGFFLLDRHVADVLVDCRERNAHLIGLILWSGFPYRTVKYDRGNRVHGKSRWTFGRKLKYSIDVMAAFSYLPLRLASVLGLILSLLGGLYALVVILMRILNDIPVPGFAALMVVILLMSGVQLVMLGIIGEYVWRGLDAARHRPIFVVDSVIGGGVDQSQLAELPVARSHKFE